MLQLMRVRDKKRRVLRGHARDADAGRFGCRKVHSVEASAPHRLAQQRPPQKQVVALLSDTQYTRTTFCPGR